MNGCECPPGGSRVEGWTSGLRLIAGRPAYGDGCLRGRARHLRRGRRSWGPSLESSRVAVCSSLTSTTSQVGRKVTSSNGADGPGTRSPRKACASELNGRRSGSEPIGCPTSGSRRRRDRVFLVRRRHLYLGRMGATGLREAGRGWSLRSQPVTRSVTTKLQNLIKMGPCLR